MMRRKTIKGFIYFTPTSFFQVQSYVLAFFLFLLCVGNHYNRLQMWQEDVPSCLIIESSCQITSYGDLRRLHNLPQSQTAPFMFRSLHHTSLEAVSISDAVPQSVTSSHITGCSAPELWSAPLLVTSSHITGSSVPERYSALSRSQ